MTTTLDGRRTPPGSQEDIGQPIQNIEVSVTPDAVRVELLPRHAGSPLERLRPLWHEVVRLPRMVLSVTSSDERPRLLRLSTRSTDSAWRSWWTRWTFAVRTVPEIHGGDAVAAQDITLEDDTILQILVLPGETREVALEFRPVLDGTTHPGDYVFDIVYTDVNDRSEGAVSAMLVLRHPDSVLERQLPAIYAEEMDRLQEASGEPYEPPFFRRYLRGFDDALEPMKETLDNLHRFFGAYETPPDFLPWLATWVDLVLDQNWPEMKRRRLIREAVELYRWRGTRRGLMRYLEIYAGVKPEINDRPFRGMRLGPDTVLGTGLEDPEKAHQNTVLGDVPDHTFVVTIAVPDPSAISEQTVRDIIDAQKPAHTAYVVRIVRRTSSEE